MFLLNNGPFSISNMKSNNQVTGKHALIQKHLKDILDNVLKSRISMKLDTEFLWTTLPFNPVSLRI